MAKTLINAYQKSINEIKHLYLEDGEFKKEVVRFKPFLGYHASKTEKTSWTDIYGKPVKVKVFEDIQSMYLWKKETKEVMDILGDVSPVIQFIAAQYRDDIPFSKEGLKIGNIDIEVDADEFPKVGEAKYPINAITVNEMVSNTYVTFSDVDYTPKHKNQIYIKCNSENEILEKFLAFWNKEDFPIITGWNIKYFDITYLVNRINRVLGAEEVKKLSKDRKINSHNETDMAGNAITTYSLQGHIIWDYMELYKKYTQEKRESYSLEFISMLELGEGKVKYHDEYDNLQNLYRENPQKFIEYNIADTNLVYQLNGKLTYVDLALTIMHKAKCQPEQIFKTVGPWDCIIYNELLKRKMLCPPNNNHQKQDFIGGYVGDPTPGLHQWTMVYDIVSSYPNQIRSGNFSPETIIADKDLTAELRKIKSEFSSIDKCADINKLNSIKSILQKHQVSFSSNGYFYDISKEGIIPSIFTDLFMQRKEYKKKLKEYKSKGMKHEAAIADLFQYTLKILLNSGYGFMSNVYSRYFDIRIAEAITSNGQVCCKGAIKHITTTFSTIECIYADTDSNFFNFSKIVEKRYGNKEVSKEDKLKFLLKFSEQCIEPELNKFFNKLAENMNFRQLTIGMEPECIADVTLFVAKKRYIMNKIWDEGEFLVEKPKRKIRGVEIVRSSTPMIIRDKLKEAVELIFKTQSNEVLIKFISDFKNEFIQMPIETIAFPRSVTIGNYDMSSKGLPIGVKAALVYNMALQMKGVDKKYPPIHDSDKIKFCYIKEPNHFRSYVIGFLNRMPEELRDCYKIDYEMQFTKTFVQPLENIFKAIKWSIDAPRSLEDFFS